MSEIIEIKLHLNKEDRYPKDIVKVNKKVLEHYMNEYVVSIPANQLQRFFLGQWAGFELREHACKLYKSYSLEKNIIELNQHLNIKKLPFYTWASIDLAIFDVFGQMLRPTMESHCQHMFETEIKSKIKINKLNGKKVRFVKKESEVYIIPDKLFQKMTFLDYEDIEKFVEKNKLTTIQ